MATAKRRSRNLAPPAPTRKAYLNPRFLASPEARMIRMMAEYLEPLQRFQRTGVRETIVMFGSARARPPDAVRAEHDAALRERKRLAGPALRTLNSKIARLETDLRLSRYYEEAEELSALLTRWARSLGKGPRFVVCSGGGPGIMEGANRGASERAGGPTVGLTISLPSEERPNPYITPELLFEFHYFFMRKLWFAYLASALVVFPGGYGTMDELFELLTLAQTRKIERPMPIVLYGSRFWREIINFQGLVDWGVIGPEDLNLFKVCDTPREAFDYLRLQLARHYPRPLTWGIHHRV